ncbi:MAG: BTAD domain-containing putative transcriptional regulator [Candidatus Eisenbacteria bacterium]
MNSPRKRSSPTTTPSTSSVLRSKLVRPNEGPHLLDRSRLVDGLAAHADRPLSLVVADAGYGKTTLLVAASQRLRRPVLWYSLLASDADPVVFGRHLLAVFRSDDPRFGRDLERALAELKPGPRAGEVLGGVLVNAVAALKGPARLLVLDDFHEVAHEPGVLAIVESLLRQPSDRLQLWIASRTLPPLAIERLRVRGDVFELDSDQLAFTREEIQGLFGEVFSRPAADEEVAALETATRGWPTALHLVHAALERSPGASVTEAARAVAESPLDLHSYFSSEVYARLDADSRRVLERTSALDHFDPGLAQALAGIPGSRTVLASLTRRGLLRSFGSGAATTFACPELVRSFVRTTIEEAGGTEALPRLEAETALVLRARGEAERALRHALRSGAPDVACALTVEIAASLLREGRAAALLEYVASLPESRVEADTVLRRFRADAHQALGHWNEAALDYEAALAAARAQRDREAETRALLGLGKVWNLRGHHEQVLGLAERALAGARDLPADVRVRLLQTKAAAHFYLGQFSASVALLDQVRALLASAPDPDLIVPTVHNLAIAYAAQGRYREASVEFRAALAQVRGAASPRAPLYLSNLATLLLEVGEWAEARDAAEEGLAAAQRFSNRMHETMCHEALAEVLAHTGDLDGALASLRRAEELNADLRMDVLAADLLALRGRIFCARGQYRRAVEFMTRALDHLAERPDAPRRTSFVTQLAWCELRAGRPTVARDRLEAEIAAVDQGENDDQRMRVHYWLAEAQLALGEAPKEAARHLAIALERVRVRGYQHFLRVQAREEPAPLLRALELGVEVDARAGALVEAGATVEAPLLGLLGAAPIPVGEAALTVLAEIGGEAALLALPGIARTRRALAPAARTALKHIEERDRRGRAPRPEGKVRAGTTVADGPGATRLVLFGPPRLEIDGRAVPASAWRTQRAFHVVLALALQPRGMSREMLIESFWPGRQAAAGRRNFHPTLSYLRALLPRTGEPPLARDAEIYRLNPDYAWSCDLWEFDAAYNEARRATGDAAIEAAYERLVALADRPLLEGMYGAWAEESQARARDRIEQAWRTLGRLRVLRGDNEAALAAFRRASELDEFRESTRVAVVECLVRLGNRRAAIVEAERLREILARDLGVEPLPETEEALLRALGGSALARNAKPLDESNAAQRVTKSDQVKLKPSLAGSRR